jgi:hypothetical protein
MKDFASSIITVAGAVWSVRADRQALAADA